MFGFGRKKKVQEAKEFFTQLSDAVDADIDAYVRDHVVPTRENYLSVLKETLAFDESEEVSPTEAGYENFQLLLEEWTEGACPNFYSAGEVLWATFEDNDMPDIAEAVKKRFDHEIGEQSYILACDGIEFTREAIAAYNGDLPLNGEGMESIREIVRTMGNPNKIVDWDKVLGGEGRD